MPSSDSTTLISTSSGSERRACFRAFTTASAPLARTARTSPLTPFTSRRFPWAIRPCQLKSCAVAVANAARHSATAVMMVRIMILRSVRGRVGTAICLLVGTSIHARVCPSVPRSIRLRVLRGVRFRVASGIAPRAPVEMETEARIAVAVAVVVVVEVIVVVVVVLVLFDPLPHLLRATQLDVSLERLQLHPRAPGADLERLAMLARGIGHGKRETRVDVAIRRRHRDGDIGALRDGHRDVPVVRSKAVRPAIGDRPLVDDVA